MNRKVELDLLQLVDGCFDVAKSKFRGSLCLLNSVKIMSNARGGGGMCRLDPKTLDLYQS